jgi:hypothetical protein
VPQKRLEWLSSSPAYWVLADVITESRYQLRQLLSEDGFYDMLDNVLRDHRRQIHAQPGDTFSGRACGQFFGCCRIQLLAANPPSPPP